MDEFTHYVIFLNAKPSVETAQELIKGHVAFLRELEKSGRLVMAGPFTDYQGGMVILRAKDKSEAERIAGEDPFVKSGVRDCEIRTWKRSCEANNHLGRG